MKATVQRVRPLPSAFESKFISNNLLSFSDFTLNGADGLLIVGGLGVEGAGPILKIGLRDSGVSGFSRIGFRRKIGSSCGGNTDALYLFTSNAGLTVSMSDLTFASSQLRLERCHRWALIFDLFWNILDVWNDLLFFRIGFRLLGLVSFCIGFFCVSFFFVRI